LLEELKDVTERLEIMDHCSSKTGKIDYFLFVQRKLSKAGIDTVPLETGK
jgi:hypothetical protein